MFHVNSLQCLVDPINDLFIRADCLDCFSNNISCRVEISGGVQQRYSRIMTPGLERRGNSASGEVNVV